MKAWGKYVAATAAVVLVQGLAQAALLPVQDATFSRPIVSLGQQASPFLAGTGWSTNGPALMEFPTGSGYWVNVGTLVWQNPAVGAYNHVDNLITDPTVTMADDPDPANYPYQGCASLSAETGNEFVQLLGSNFQVGRSYALTVGIGRNFGNADQVPAASAEIRLALFYTDDSSVRHLLTSTDVFNDATSSLSANHLQDFSTPGALIATGDPAAGRPVGVLLTTIGPAGGYFNASNVRVSEVPEPASLGVLLAGTVLLMRRRRVRAA